MTDHFERGELIVGRYRVLSKLGGGGMADVYLAEDLKLGRKVALKVLLRRYAGDAQFVERFRREAQAAAQLNHANIVGIYDWGTIGDTYYIAMEYVEGETLKDRIRREGRLQPAEAVTITLALLAALDTAHAAGIVHRDIKSQNILIDAGGALKVTDFGIAKAGDSQMTEAGSILGTAQYLAPEQAKGMDVDERSDLYSAGVVLYEMLVGDVPFHGDSAVTVALKHVNEPPPEPASLVPGLPYALNQIVLKAMAKDPDQRYRNAAEFAGDLQSARRGGPLLAAAYDPAMARTQVLPAEAATRVLPRSAAAPGSPPPRRRKRRIWPWILLALFLAAAAVAAVLVVNALSGGGGVTVPQVVGLAQAPATTKLQQAGFTVKALDDYSDQFQTGFVMRQDPQGDSKVDDKGVVRIWVSRGPLHMQLTDFRGWKAADVVAWLQQNGLVGVAKNGTSTTVAKGHVFKQDPPAGQTVARGDTVTYWVSQGKPQVPVPDVSGMNLAQATSAIEGAGLLVGAVTQRASDTVPVGEVVEQNPSADTPVAKGSQVDLVMSLGPSPSPSSSTSPTAALVTVPPVVTMLRADAESQLTGLGFIVITKIQPSAQTPGTVFDQKPDPGTKLPYGSTVTIRVSK